MEQTLSFIKPDAVGANEIGGIIEKYESAGLTLVAAKMMHLSLNEAEKFYEIHKERPFFGELTSFISSGPIFVMILEGPDAVATTRKIMGATDPSQAEPGTIRAEYAKSIDQNAIHGSDSLENAKNEISFFFKKDEIFTRNT